MNGHDVAMRRMMGSDAFSVWKKQFTRGFLRCDIIDYFEKFCSARLFQEIFDRDFFWYEHFMELQKFGGTALRLKLPERLRHDPGESAIVKREDDRIRS